MVVLSKEERLRFAEWCEQEAREVDGTLEARMGQRLTFTQAVQAATQAWKRFLQEVA